MKIKERADKIPVQPVRKKGELSPKVGISDYWLGLVLVLTLFAYSPVFNADFINWDDNVYVYQNEQVKGFSHLKELLTTPIMNNHQPLTMLSLAANYEYFGKGAGSFHVVNVLLHLANTFLVYFLVLILYKNSKITALVSAMLFGLHPVHVESVAWVSERKDVLYALFFLAGLITYLKFVDTKVVKYYVFTVVLLALSLLSKSAAVVFPVALLVIDFLRSRKFSIGLFAEKIPFFALALIMGFLTLSLQDGSGNEVENSFSFDKRIFFGFYGYMMYCIKFILPINLVPFYPFPDRAQGLPVSYLISPLFFVATIGAAFYFFKKGKREVAFSFGFYLVNVILVLQVFALAIAVISEHYVYVAYIGIFFLVGWMIEKLSEKIKAPWQILVFVPAFIYSGLTYAQASKWKNSETLWDYVIKTYPSSRAYNNRAMLYRKEGKADKALALYTEALKMHDDVIEDATLTNRGNIFFDKKQYVQAIMDYNGALKIKPKDDNTIENRGAAYLMLEKFDSAMIDFNRAAEINPGNSSVNYKRGILYMNTNRKKEATEYFLKYLSVKPNDFEVLNTLAGCYQAIQQHEDAINYFTKAINLNQKPVFYMNRSFSYDATGKTDLAKNDAITAKKGGVNIPEKYAQHLGI